MLVELGFRHRGGVLRRYSVSREPQRGHGTGAMRMML
jgi:hypothetical protein